MEISKEKVNLISHLTLNQMRQSSTVILTDLTSANIYIFQENISPDNVFVRIILNHYSHFYFILTLFKS